MKRGDVDRAVDEQLYWHASQRPLPVGVVIHSRGSRAFTYPFVDDLRPEGTPRRADHLFMVKDYDCLEALGQDPGGNYLYRVRPVAPVTKGNFRWLEKVAERAMDEPDVELDPEAVQWARNYWSGKQPRDGKGKCRTEYLTMAFEVVR